MKFSEYCQLDALELARRVRSGEVRARELAELAIQQAEKIQPILNPICQPLYDKARQTANNQGQVDGAFAGVPFLVKDLGMHVAGTPTTMGCKAFRNAVVEQDSEYVRRCRRAGLVIIGKTTTPELGLKATTETALWGATRNPWNPEHTPGGSSGGSTAAVAAGVVPMASADDGGGSIRIPAAYCGLFGLKPTRGRVSYAPDAAESWSGAGARGVVSLSVRDSAAALDFLQGAVPGEP